MNGSIFYAIPGNWQIMIQPLDGGNAYDSGWWDDIGNIYSIGFIQNVDENPIQDALYVVAGSGDSTMFASINTTTWETIAKKNVTYKHGEINFYNFPPVIDSNFGAIYVLYNFYSPNYQEQDVELQKFDSSFELIGNVTIGQYLNSYIQLLPDDYSSDLVYISEGDSLYQVNFDTGVFQNTHMNSQGTIGCMLLDEYHPHQSIYIGTSQSIAQVDITQISLAIPKQIIAFAGNTYWNTPSACAMDKATGTSYWLTSSLQQLQTESNMWRVITNPFQVYDMAVINTTDSTNGIQVEGITLVQNETGVANQALIVMKTGSTSHSMMLWNGYECENKIPVYLWGLAYGVCVCVFFIIYGKIVKLIEGLILKKRFNSANTSSMGSFSKKVT